MTRKARAAKTTSVTAPEPAWAEEWIVLDHIIRHQPFQVRRKLDPVAVRRYQERMALGHQPPPIKVARLPDGRLILVDGWHRLAADALQVDEFSSPSEVLAQVAPMTEKQAQWAAAWVNMDHGVSLKPSEMRAVFRAFIESGQHKKKGGRLMSYREMGAVLGKPHSTVRNWMKKDFPQLAQELGSESEGNRQADVPDRPVNFFAEQMAEVMRATRGLMGSLELLSDWQRYELAAQLRATLAEVERLGTAPPEF